MAPTADITEGSFLSVWTDVSGFESVVRPECLVLDTPSAATHRSERGYPERDRRPPERFTFYIGGRRCDNFVCACV